MLDAHLHLPENAAPLPAAMTCFLNATEPGEWPRLAELAAGREGAVPFFGIHPWYVSSWRGGDLQRLEERLRQDPGAQVGEIGLDWIKAGREPENCPWEEQLRLFKAQLALAINLERAVAVHCVRAWEELFTVLDELRPSPGYLYRAMLHFFGSSPQVMQRLLGYGFMISFSPRVHGSQAALASLRACPRERLLLETDLPAGSQSLEELQTHYHRVAGLLQLPGAELKELVEKNGKVFTHTSVAGR